MTDADRDALVPANMGLAYEWARRLYNADILVQRLGTCEDAEQEALTALIKAARGYRPELGWQFTTYAVAVIRRELRRRGLRAGPVVPPDYLIFSQKAKEESAHARAAQSAIAATGSLESDFDRASRGNEEPSEPDVLPRIRDAFRLLPPRSREILARRFGLAGRPETLEAIGASLDVTRERVRQLEAKALARLKRHLQPQPTKRKAG